MGMLWGESGRRAIVHGNRVSKAAKEELAARKPKKSEFSERKKDGWKQDLRDLASGGATGAVIGATARAPQAVSEGLTEAYAKGKPGETVPVTKSLKSGLRKLPKHLYRGAKQMVIPGMAAGTAVRLIVKKVDSVGRDKPAA
jgi:hypothetical protein